MMSNGPRVGELFAGRYRIEALLGEGGMGAVYRATDENVGDVLALKTLILRGDKEKEAIERFRREVRLARSITHPSVARIHDLGQHEDVHFLTMEYVRGRDLQQVLDSEGPLTASRAVELALPVVEALDAIHAAGVVHRDVKPANVLVEDGHRVVLTDFGIARTELERAATLQTAGPIGTPLYMAPEQVAGRPVDHRTDLYACGLVLFELLTGEVPFLAASPLATAVARLSQPPPDPRTLLPIPDALAELVLQCLALRPEDRPESARALASALRGIAAGEADTRAPAARLEVMATAQALPTVPKGETVSPGDRTLAVLPFRYRGPSDHDYLGDALTDELIDLLSTTRGLRVLASGATQGYRTERDPRTLGSALGADALVDGTVQIAGTRVRVAARLWEVWRGTQLWNDRFEGSIEDVFALQDQMARRIAEALRVELSTAAHHGTAPQEAVETYLRARKKMRSRSEDTSLTGPGGVVDMLDQCLGAAPQFAPALAAHAMATVRAWFIPGPEGEHWATVARQSVARAIEHGAHLAETQLAAAMLAVQEGDYLSAARHLDQALRLAPTYADAQDYLGRLQCEAGKAEEGLRRLRLALDLDPTLVFACQDIARVEELHGRRDESERAQRRLERGVGLLHPAVASNRMRFAMWRGDREALQKLVDSPHAARNPSQSMLALCAATAIGSIEPQEAARAFDGFIETVVNLRFRNLAMQLACESLTAAGAHELGIRYLEQTGSELLLDVLWLDRCPVLEPLRNDDRFHVARHATEERAATLWML